ncbi:LmbU family transcriptional regulator [Streptomyces sp. NBC_00083]|uniref:LmbU family transcriptional regulator n=1 Tax=Streptomyces sp. NBC_00083 TaxID=2975647 RepID=UPI002251424D|nr:LmbU family transcriptional regulator [Streptomyces sp. NBC_00083]MCX5386232.1 LmbU family transcriptional regulator [Streptomyces sp. NBC_00083]
MQFHKSGLSFTSRQSLNTWEQVGTGLLSFADSSTWWVADWLVYGESEFQDRYHEAVKRTSLSYQTLRNYTWVARKFPLTRRRQNLSFSHHLEVVALDQPEQDYWLRKAEALRWSRNKLRGEVRSSLRARQSEVTESKGRVEPAKNVTAGAGSVAGRAASVETGAGAGPERREAESCTEAGQLRIELPAGILAQLRTAASREGSPVEAWAMEILRRAAGES